MLVGNNQKSHSLAIGNGGCGVVHFVHEINDGHMKAVPKMCLEAFLFPGNRAGIRVSLLRIRVCYCICYDMMFVFNYTIIDEYSFIAIVIWPLLHVPARRPPQSLSDCEWGYAGNL